MTLYKYVVFDQRGREIKGQIDAYSKEAAISSLQKRGYIVSSVKEYGEGGILDRKVVLSGVKNKEIVMLTKQLSTLFEAQVPAIKIFRMLAEESKNKIIKRALNEMADDISDGSSVANSMAKHNQIFSSFYVNMIASGEESGKMSQTFSYLADYLERSYAVTSKVKSSMMYPTFVMGVFIIVMYIMMTVIIPRISGMLKDNGEDLPLVTEIVMWASDFLVDYGFILIAAVVVGIFLFIKYIKTPVGKLMFDSFKLSIPVVGRVYKDLYISRIAGNISMMLKSGVTMIKTIESSAKVVDNRIYEDILKEILDDVKGGVSLSKAFQKHSEFSGLFVQMVRVGEESGKLSDILDTMAKFYEKEVINRINALISLLEPLMLTLLGGGVGLLLAAVLLPIYMVTNTTI